VFGAGAANANLSVTFVSASLAGVGLTGSMTLRWITTQNVNNSTFSNFITVYDFGLPGTVSFVSDTGLLATQGWGGAFCSYEHTGV